MPDHVGHDCLTGNLLLIERSSNVNRTSNYTTYLRVVTDAEFLPANCASECIRPIVSLQLAPINKHFTDHLRHRLIHHFRMSV